MWFRRSKAATEEAKHRTHLAEQALREADAAHKRVKRRGNEVSAITTSLREFRERNHISEQLQTIMEGN